MISARDANLRLRRTINLGLDLGAPSERGWTVAVDDSQLAACAEAGFTAIRLGVCWSAHPGAGDEVVDPNAVARVIAIARAATARGLAIVITNFLDPELMADPPRYRARLLAIATTVARSLRELPGEVLIEPLAEPRAALDPVWNDYAHALIAATRSVDHERVLVIGPRSYNNARFLGELALPTADRQLIVAIHHYWPITFTMQGETWLGSTPFGEPASWLGTTWQATPQERGELEAGFSAVASWAAAQDRPIFIGELGTSSNADMASRVRWTRFNRELAEHCGFSWGYWSFGPSFALWDVARGAWHADLLAALIG